MAIFRAKPKKQPVLLPLLCGYCMFIVAEGEHANEADTIINGNAVCTPHLYLARDNKFMLAVNFGKKELLSE